MSKPRDAVYWFGSVALKVPDGWLDGYGAAYAEGSVYDGAGDWGAGDPVYADGSV